MASDATAFAPAQGRLGALRGRAGALPRPQAETLAFAVFLAVVAAFYAWTAATSDPFRFDSTGTGTGRYGWLADALLHGQLHLRMHVPQGLLELSNPYDPAKNAQFRIPQGLQDLTLWHGKFYMYWGIVPEIIFVPLRLFGIWMSSSLAATMLFFGGFVFSALTLRFLVRRFLPDTPSWALWAGMATLACGNVAPFTLRHPEHSEIAIGGGLCFGFIAIWLSVTGWLAPTVSLRRLTGASLALGLAIGSRPTWLVLAVVPVVLSLGAFRSGLWPGNRGPTWFVFALWGPLTTCGLLLMAYNLARFGSPFELGARYQLAGFDQQGYGPFDARFLGPGLFYYLFEPLTPEALFPFASMGPAPFYPWSLPKGYQQSEVTAGILPTAPIVLALVFLPVVARHWPPVFRRIVWVLVALGCGVLILVSGAVWSTTQRYAVDFTSLLLMGALLVWLSSVSRGRPSGRRRLSIVVGSVAAAFTVLMGLSISFVGYGQPLKTKHPALWADLESKFSPVSRVMATLAGGPVIPRIVGSPLNREGVRIGWSSLGLRDITFSAGAQPVVLRVASARRETRVLHAVVRRRSVLPPGVPATITVASGDGAAVVLPVSDGAQAMAVPITVPGGVSSIAVTAQAPPASGSDLVLVSRLNLEKR
ncbi:MAG: hypothetical protein JWR63_3326 [Conexibacter sp.]|nr:hypothetical protein [Conexibacter sp.]